MTVCSSVSPRSFALSATVSTALPAGSGIRSVTFPDLERPRPEETM